MRINIRVILLAALCLTFLQPAYAGSSFALVNNALGQSDTTPTTTPTKNISGTNLNLVSGATIGGLNTNCNSFTDVASNTFTANGSVSASDPNGATIEHAYNLGGSTSAVETWSCHATSGTAVGTVIGAAFSGAKSSGVVDGSPVTGHGHAVQTIASSTFTPTNDGELLIASCAVSGDTSGFMGGGTVSGSVGWTLLNSAGIIPGTAIGGGMWYQIQGAKSAKTFTCTQTVDTGEMDVVVVGYNPASYTPPGGNSSNPLFHSVP